MRYIEPLGIGVADALAFVVFVAAIDRFAGGALPIVFLARSGWACTASHDEKQQVHRDSGGSEYRSDEVCDQWSRR